MRKTAILLAISSALLSGCASNSGVVDMGSGTFFVSRQASTGLGGMGTLRADAYRDATAKCHGKPVSVVKTEESKPPYILGNFPRVDLTFRCG